MKNLIIGLIILQSTYLFSSDHIDGVPTKEDKQVDLSDLYAFKTPGKENSLTMILNLYPGVKEKGHFSSKVSYDLVLRKASRPNPPKLNLFETIKDSEAIISCSFTEENHHKNPSARATCEIRQEGELTKSLSAKVGERKESKELGFKIYTGVRSDPFFLRMDQFVSVTKREGFEAIKGLDGNNLLESINVLSIVVEIDVNLIFKKFMPEDILALTAQSYYTKSSGEKTILDKVGRPEITNLSLHRFGEGKAIKLEYNSTPAFDEKHARSNNKFKKRLKENIIAYDKLGGKKDDWSAQELEIFTSLLLDDYILINLSPNCKKSSNNFLSIEKAFLSSDNTNVYCGGRHLTDDIMSTLYSLYIGGPKAQWKNYQTGVNIPYQSDSKKNLFPNFPYLYHPGKTGIIKTKNQFLLELGRLKQD